MNDRLSLCFSRCTIRSLRSSAAHFVHSLFTYAAQRADGRRPEVGRVASEARTREATDEARGGRGTGVGNDERSVVRGGS